MKRGPTLPVAKTKLDAEIARRCSVVPTSYVRTLRPPPIDRAGVRPDTVTYRDPEDRLVTIERLAIRNAIVLALQDGPRHKWQLREGLHLPEQLILRELHVLRDDGAVKPVGKRFTDRQWALASWQPPPKHGVGPLPHPAGTRPIYPDGHTAIRSGKPEPTTESSWTRPEFRYAGNRASYGAHT